MFALLGWILLLGGIGTALAIFTGMAPVALANLGVPFWVWIASAACGGFLLMLNRRPGN